MVCECFLRAIVDKSGSAYICFLLFLASAACIVVLTNLPWQICCNSHSHGDRDSQLRKANASANEIHTFSEGTPTAIRRLRDGEMCDKPLGYLQL